jgi:arylsulfatase A-like enzyme
MLACGQEPDQVNVLIIGVDALRRDHLGCYGYERDISPHIDELAAGGALCENAVTQAPWTLPSFSTVFTSLYPTQHGAVGMGQGLRTSVPTLAEILKTKGYATGALINGPALKPKNGVDRGFDFYHKTALEERNARGTTRDALAWVDALGGQPFFLFAHYFDPHAPYSPPPPYHAMSDPEYSGSIGGSFDPREMPGSKEETSLQMASLTEEDWNRIISLYDGEIAFTDEAIGSLLRGLEQRGLLRNTLVVLLSDHGEEFFDHRSYGHAHSLYDELLKVPLVLSLPGVIPHNARLARQVRLLDVTPTILDVLGISPTTNFEGTSLLPLLLGKGAAEAETHALLPADVAYAEAVANNPGPRCIISHPWKLMYNVATGEKQLFNLDRDPAEQKDLAEMEPGHLRMLEDLMMKVIFGISDTWYVELSGGGLETRFDLKITAERDMSIGTIRPYRFLDSAGNFVDIDGAVSSRKAGAVLIIGDLNVSGDLTLAFRVSPEQMPLEFDVSIDGKQDPRKVYLGGDLSNPDGLPFLVGRRRGLVKSDEKPSGMPQTPLVVIWLDQSQYRGKKAVSIDSETRKELRALGYIQ